MPVYVTQSNFTGFWLHISTDTDGEPQAYVIQGDSRDMVITARYDFLGRCVKKKKLI